MLPEQFLDRMKQMLGEEFPAFLESYEQEKYQALRINPQKTTIASFMEKSPFLRKPVPWEKNGFYYDREDAPGKHPYHAAGVYYIQEPSAMAPASILPVEDGDVVLDICAAPGGKSTELAAKLHGTGFLISNDISNSRAKALLKNLELFLIASL